MGGVRKRVRTDVWLPRAAQAVGVALFLGLHLTSLGFSGPWPWIWGLGFALLALWSAGFALIVALATVCGLSAAHLLPALSWAWLAVLLLLVFGGGLLALIRSGYRFLPRVSTWVSPALLVLLAPSSLRVGLLPAVMLLVGLLFGVWRGLGVAALAFLWTSVGALWQGAVPAWGGILALPLAVPPCRIGPVSWSWIPEPTRTAWERLATLVVCHLGPPSPFWRASYIVLGREGLFLLSLALVGALLRRFRGTLFWVPALYWLAGTLILQQRNAPAPPWILWLAGLLGTAGVFLVVAWGRPDEPGSVGMMKRKREISP